MREMINTCRQLSIYNSGRLEYYHQLKTLISDKCWKTFFNEMFEATTFSDYFSFGGNINTGIFLWKRMNINIFFN